MTPDLSRNIRSLRKERKLTQEQLAEALNVTAGAVYKWEAGLSVPELDLIVEMADFFDVSIDALLGYRIRNNSLTAIGDRISEYLRTGDSAALSEAEKALKRYPNSLKVVFGCAQIFHVFGLEQHRTDLLHRALELYEQSLLLIPQDAEPDVTEYAIYGQIGAFYVSTGEPEKGVDILKKHNTCGIFDSDIGITLSMLLRRPNEAEPFLTDSLLNSVLRLMDTVTGYAFLYAGRGDHASEREVVSWGREILSGIRKQNKADYFDKTDAILMTLLAHAALRLGNAEEAGRFLKKTASVSRRFDVSPDYGISSIRFVSVQKDWNLHDMLGRTVEESVGYIVSRLSDPALASLWMDISGEISSSSESKENL